MPGPSNTFKGILDSIYIAPPTIVAGALTCTTRVPSSCRVTTYSSHKLLPAHVSSRERRLLEAGPLTCHRHGKTGETMVM